MVTTSTKFSATVGGASANVYGKSRLMETDEVVPTEVWGHGDTVEQSWLIIKGSTASNVVLTRTAGAITSYNIYPENIATSVAINGGNLEFTVPSSAKLRVEINGDRAECFHVFAGPATPRSSADPDLTDWTTLVKSVQSIDHTTNTVNCNAHGFSNGDQVHLYSTGNLPTVANPGSLTNGPSALFAQGPILSHSPAWVANASTNSFTLVHRDLTTAVDFLDNGTGTFSVSTGEYTDTGNALYFPSGSEYHMGMQMDLATNTEVFIDEDAIVHGSFNLQDADGVVIHGGGMLTGGYRQRKELDSSTAFTQCVEHTLFIGDFHGGQTNGYPANKNSGDGSFDNEVKDITVVDNAFYINNKGVWSWRDVSYINIWSYNADGFRTAPKTLTDQRGEIVDCFTFASDDCCKFQLDNKHQLLDNVFAVAAANGCFQGYSWPTSKAEGFSALIQNCHAMHLMGPDTGGDPYDPATVFPAYGTRHIIRSYTDGYVAEKDYGHSNVVFRNLNVWGPCEVRLLSAGNNPYPFGQSQVRDQYGQMRNWVLEDITVHTPPTVMSGSKSRIHARDDENRPEDWLMMGIDFGGTIVTEANKDTYFEIDAEVRNLQFFDSGKHFTIGSGWPGFDYTTVSAWLGDRKAPSPARSNTAGEVEAATLMDASFDFVSDNWGGWASLTNGNLKVILRPGYKHNGDWASGTTLTNTSAAFGSNTIFAGQQAFTIDIDDFVIDLTGQSQPLLRLQNNNASNTNPFNLVARRCLMVPGTNGAFADSTNNTSAAAEAIYTYENCVVSSKGTAAKPVWASGFSTTNQSNTTVVLRHCTIDNSYVKGNQGGGSNDLDVQTYHCLIRENSSNPSGTSPGFVQAPVTGTLTGASYYTFTDEAEAEHLSWATTETFKNNYETEFVYNTRATKPGVVSFKGTGTDPKLDYALTSGGFNTGLGAEDDDPSVASYGSTTSDDLLGNTRYNADAGAFNGDDFQILGLERIADINTGLTIRTGDYVTVRDWGNQTNKQRTWTWGDGDSITTGANDFYSHTHRYDTAGSYGITLSSSNEGTSQTQTITVTDPQAIDIDAISAHTGGGNINYYLSEPVANLDWDNLSNVFVEIDPPADATTKEFDPGPNDNSWQSAQWDVRDLAAPLTPLYVYSYGEEIPGSISNQIWQTGDTDVDQAWVNCWADGAVTFLCIMSGVALDGLSEATSVEVYPKNVCSIGYSGGTALIKVPYNTKVRVEGATNRKNALHLFNSPARTATPAPGDVTNWNDRVYTVSSVNNSGSATEFTVGSLDLTAYTNGDTFRVIYTNADTATYPTNQGNHFGSICTTGDLTDYEIVTATVVNNTNPGVIKLTDSTSANNPTGGVDILLNTAANPSNHQIGITDLVAANTSDITFGDGDVNQILYFPRGVHKIGRLFQLAGGNNNTQDVAIPTRTIHMDPGAMVIGSLDFRRRDPANSYNVFTTSQGHGQGITIQGGGHYSQQFASRNDLGNGSASGAQDLRGYGAAWGGTDRNNWRSFQNEAVGGLIANNTIKEITHFAQNFHHGKHQAARYSQFKSISPWYWNCDGVQVYRDGIDDGGDYPTGYGSIKDCFLFQGDDVVFLIRQGGGIEISRSFFVSTANTALNGGYWATTQSNAGQHVRVNDCDVMALGAADSGKQQNSFWDIDHGTPATATIQVGGVDWLTFSAYPYETASAGYAAQYSYGANGNGWDFTVSAASTLGANYFDLTITDGTRTETFTDIAGPNALAGDPTNGPEYRIMNQANASQTPKRSSYFLVSEDNVAVTSGNPTVGTVTSSGGVDPAVGTGPQGVSGPGIGSRSIFRCHSDGADADLDSGCMRKQNNPASDYFVLSENYGNGSTSGVDFVVENIRIWGPVTQRPFSIGNIRYPFWGGSNPYGSRDSYGVTENVTLRNWTFEQEPAQQALLQGLDATSKPDNIVIENWNVAGERLDTANYTDYILADGGSSTITAGTAGTNLVLDADGSDPDIMQVSWSGETPTTFSTLTGASENVTIATGGAVTSYGITFRASGMNVSYGHTLTSAFANEFASNSTATAQHGTLIGQIVTQAAAATATSEDGTQNIGTSQSSLATATADDGAQTVTILTASVTRNVLATATAHLGSAGIVQNAILTEAVLANATAILGYTLTEAGSLLWASPLQSNQPYDKMAGVGPAPRGRNPS